jgi:hypothetical protein
MAAMSSWTSVLQQLAELDPDDFDPAHLSDEQLRETAPLTQFGINRLSAVLTRSVAAGEAQQMQKADGMASMTTWLTGHCRLSGREATALVHDGRRLIELPSLAAAYSAGEVTAAHVAMVTSAVTPARMSVAAANGIDVATTDAVLTQAARALGPEVRVSIDLMAPCADRAAPGVAGGQLPVAGPITPETARRLACDAGVVRLLTGPHG